MSSTPARYFALLSLAGALCAGTLGAAILDFGSMPAGAAAPTDQVAEAAATLAEEDCNDRLAQTEERITITLASLGSARAAPPAARCEAYRNHIMTLNAATETYGACMTGFHRDELVGQFTLAADDWNGVVAEMCQ